MDKIDTTSRYGGDWSWIGHPNGVGTDEASLWVHNNREQLEVVGGVSDVDACYSYWDYALVRLGETYALVETSGCSCPSPDETWGVTKGPCTLQEIITWFNTAEGFHGVTVNQKAEFIVLFEKALVS